ncbi:MAG TPA: SprT-like domain-containing protein [Polyangiaceae bacterium]
MTTRVLVETYEDLNRALFKGSLQRPVLAFVERKMRLGQWHSAERRLELSEHLLLEQGWGVLIEVLKHEMAHQYVDEVLRLTDVGPHGDAFRRVCEARGIDASATGLPSAESANDERTRRIDQVTKLLRLAKSSDVYEAAAATSAAQRLMLKYNLNDLEAGPQYHYSHRHLGKVTGRVTEAERILACILGEHFFVQVIWVSLYRPFEGKRGSVLEICGTPENLELASFVYGYLLDAAERLWLTYKAEHAVKGNAHRREFLAGVLTGVRDKLVSDKRRSEREGLVWVGDSELSAYFKSRHPHIRWIRGEAKLRPDAWGKGRDAGRSLELSRPLREARHGSHPKLLPSAKSAPRAAE